MSGRYPEIVYTEEGMREGMQIANTSSKGSHPLR